MFSLLRSLGVTWPVVGSLELCFGNKRYRSSNGVLELWLRRWEVRDGALFRYRNGVRGGTPEEQLDLLNTV